MAVHSSQLPLPTIPPVVSKRFEEGNPSFIPRSLVGGPPEYNGGVARIHKDETEMRVGWMTAWYQLFDDGAMHWISMATDMCYDCGQLLAVDEEKPIPHTKPVQYEKMCVNEACSKNKGKIILIDAPRPAGGLILLRGR